VWSTPLIWNKGTTGHIPHADFGPRRAYDVILYARKGEKQVTGVYSDVIDCSPIITEERVHAAQKPVALYMNLLKRSTNGGARVLDPFAGSGTIFKAAAAMNCTAVGVELDPAQVQNCKAAIAEL
jgi:DNA modification methylase